MTDTPSTDTPSIHGDWDPAFAGVMDVLAANLADGEDVGASVAVVVDGRTVVDIWGGLADSRAGRPWQRETAGVTFSCTKAVTTAAALLLDQRGIGSLAAPVVDWWPEFGAAGKDAVTGHHLLTHTVGLPAFDRPVTSEEAADPAAMADLLAAQAPAWEPGTAHGYHALTFGWLVGEFVRRHCGSSVRNFVRAEFGPDLRFGVAETEIAGLARMSAARTPTVEPPAGGPVGDAGTVRRFAEALGDPSSTMRLSTGNPAANFAKPIVLTAGWPAAGLITTARAMASFYAGLIAGDVLDPATVRAATVERVRGADRTLISESAFGLGFMRASGAMFVPPAARPSAFGHPGASGAIGIADPDRGVAVAYIPNLVRSADLDRRAYRIVDAVYSSL